MDKIHILSPSFQNKTPKAHHSPDLNLSNISNNTSRVEKLTQSFFKKFRLKVDLEEKIDKIVKS